MENKKINPVFGVRLSDKLVRLIKVHCAKKGLKIQEFVADAIKKGLKSK